ncbi:hypothetical protein MKZ38_009048 [Zalerion maritima]|uniref:tRNA pseudouridine(55) synthase n=1 Tax=Zalerion maritima TaxID=339359 RepID=A0AAD5RUI6_9PEZI|nr:hypothetical protein MKZ38_009048 [Zalerion maritima]
MKTVPSTIRFVSRDWGGTISKMTKPPTVEGVFAINKPKGLSSAQVIRDCQACFKPSKMFAERLNQEAQKRANEKTTQRKKRRGAKAKLEVKIGHGGTLDPLASGVLLLGVENGTKQLTRFLHGQKAYETVVVFGASSDSQDRVGKLLKKEPCEHVTREKVEEALKSFVGTIKQTPPLFSALKMNGKPLYEYAREGLPIPREIPMREMEVEGIELLEWYEPGTHRHFWPREQASDEEKKLAQTVEDAVDQIQSEQKGGTSAQAPSTAAEPPSGVEATADATTTGSEDKEPAKPVPVAECKPAFTAEIGEKRKAEEEPQDDDMVYEAPSKKPKILSSPVMSGALPSDSEGTPAAPATPNTVPAAAADADMTTPEEKTAAPPSAPTPTPAPTSGPLTEPDAKTKSTASADQPSRPLIPKGKGSDLIPADDPAAPPPWDGPGPPAAKIRLRVSSGFYVRTFCHDLGRHLGSAALMAELVRTKQSMFKLSRDSVMDYELLHRGEDAWAPRLDALLSRWAAFMRNERALREEQLVGEKGAKPQEKENNDEDLGQEQELQLRLEELKKQFWEDGNV